MYLHLGNDVVVKTSEIIGIFDLDNCTISKFTKDFLYRAQKAAKIITVSPELPKSFIVCMEKNNQVIYLSQLGSITLLKRLSYPLPK